MKHTLRTLTIVVVALTVTMAVSAQSLHPTRFKHMASGMKTAWYSSDEARQAADSALHYQYPCGGWAKNHDWHAVESDSKMRERRQIIAQIAAGESLGATIDNGATTHEMLLLAKVYGACQGQNVVKKKQLKAYRDAFVRALDYLIEAQYDNGGWPQFYPLKPANNEGHPFYSDHITFNDNAMVNVMKMLRNIYEEKTPYDALHLSDKQKQQARQAFDRGVECILNCQIRKDGILTVWCQQHDEHTLQPAPARAYELASFTGSHETANILQLLMSLPNPSERVITAVTAAVTWLQAHALRDVKVETFINRDGRRDRRLVHHFGHQTWARYYDLVTEEPYVCDRDGIPQPSLEYIGYERRVGYGWYGDTPQEVIDAFPAWLETHQSH